jgi:hypothetical protein
MTWFASLLLVAAVHPATPGTAEVSAPSPRTEPASEQAETANVALVDLGMLLVREQAMVVVGDRSPLEWPNAVLDHLRAAGIPVKAMGDVLFQKSTLHARWALAATIDAATRGKTAGGLEVEATVTWRVLDNERDTELATIVTHGRAFQSGPDFLGRLLASAADELAHHESFRQVLAGASQYVNDTTSAGTLDADAMAWQRVVRKRDTGIAIGIVGVLGGGGLVAYTAERNVVYDRAKATMPENTWKELVVGNTVGWVLLGVGVLGGTWSLGNHRPGGAHVRVGPGFANVNGSF